MQDKDCGRKEVCKLGKCVPGNSGECLNDWSCGAGKCCHQGRCFEQKPPKCVRDEDCQDGADCCQQGRCEPCPMKCSNTMDCWKGGCCKQGICDPYCYVPRPECLEDDDCGCGQCCRWPEQKCKPCTVECSNDGECGHGKCCIHDKKLPPWVPRAKTGKCGPCPIVPCQYDKHCNKDSDCQRWGECCGKETSCEGDIMMSWCEPCKRPPGVCSKDRDCRDGKCCNRLTGRCDECPDDRCSNDGDCGLHSCCIHEQKLPSWVPRGKTGKCGSCPRCQIDKMCSKDSDCQKWGECCNSGICEGDIGMSWCGPCKRPAKCSSNRDCERNLIAGGKCCLKHVMMESGNCGKCPPTTPKPKGNGGLFLNLLFNILNFILSLFMN